MVPLSTINRLVNTAKDFDVSGLDIISYYLRLYAVEEILAEEERSRELTEIATELLNTVENYKKDLQQSGSDEQKNIKYTLVQNQEKAKTYFLNFAMSLYNEKLTQVQQGPWDINLRRGLWCCIDLFSTTIHLWNDEQDSLRKRIKYCKLYLSKLAKGEIGATKQGDEEANEVKLTPTPAAESEHGKKENEEHEAASASLDYADFIDDISEGTSLEAESTDLINKLRIEDEEEKAISKDEAYEDEKESENERDSTHNAQNDLPAFSLPETPVSKPHSKPEVLPQFLDSEEEDMPSTGMEEIKKDIHHEVYTKAQLHALMDKSSKIEKIQRMAKYAISALNYEDIATAKDEFTSALEMLDSL